MSWRLIFAVLLIAAGLSAWAGLRVGDWLIAHGPDAPIMPTYTTVTQIPTLDANGKPYVALAPQPLPDGRQGTPAPQPPVDLTINTAPLIDAGRPIALATTTITLDQAIQIASQNQSGSLQGIADASALMGGNQPLQPIEIQPMPPVPQPQAPTSQGNWQAAFHQELDACKQLGFFSRPSCAWAARNKYCEPNNAWGRVDGCPAKGGGF
ncbi:MAG: hypothetical protein L0H54_01115 [Alcaligenaceae bacterium]|nr:hypothetical protein [Alcaligenaceae bacterium]